MSDDELWAQWTTGIQYEIDFWDRYMEKRGEPWGEDFNRRLDPTSPADEWLEKLIAALHMPTVDILDVGAGPLSCLGKVSKHSKIQLTATDPLADFYNEIISRYDVVPPVRTDFGLAEDLSLSLKMNQFDIVHCQNALDHSIEPFRCLLQMLNVCKIGGYVMLRHAHNEAEHENYAGFHKWNLTNEGDDMIVWNKLTRMNVSDSLKKCAESKVLVSEGYLINTFKKTNSIPDYMLPDDSSRFNALLRRFIGSLGTVQSKSAV